MGGVTEQHGRVRSYRSGFDSRPAHDFWILTDFCALMLQSADAFFAMAAVVHGREQDALASFGSG